MTNQIETIMALALAYRMADTVDLWPTECDLREALEAALEELQTKNDVQTLMIIDLRQQVDALEAALKPQDNPLWPTLVRIAEHLGIDPEEARKAPGKPSDVYIAAIEAALKSGEAVLDEYDPGLLNDYGGGNVDWWWDYIRYLLGAAHEHYAEQVLATAPPAQTLCHCKDRPASECPGEWEPGCDLGNNEAYAVVVQTPPPRLTDAELLAINETVKPLHVGNYARAIETAVRKQAGWE